ncbi:MAG: class I SAM-dependent methyltransferase [candidate division WS1 bacterium]|jgi:SAM-dependent methyltransferase|nr:class I SAM-dependent methyltransferase [candidate division WS1 bacterium]
MNQRKRDAMLGAPFDDLAHKYDTWFDAPEKRPIFETEVNCLHRLLPTAERPWLEIGVGTGRFAEALGFDHGVDPSITALQLARPRGVSTCCGVAEALPYATASCNLLLMVVTLCFLSDPVRAFDECARVLSPTGSLILGLVPADSPWGRLYIEKSKSGHPYYSIAKFYTCQQTTRMAEDAGFTMVAAASCLFDPPDVLVVDPTHVADGLIADAGFVAMRFMRREAI